MSQPDEKFLERFPLLPEDVADPVPIDGQWKGQWAWTRKHGSAYIAKSMRFTARVFNARLQDGTRDDIDFVLDLGHRRPGTGNKRWIYGTIEILPDDILFTDHETQWMYIPPEPSDEPNLEMDLAGDAEFRSDLKDQRFAQAAYRSLKNTYWTKDNGKNWWTAGDRGAARIAAYMSDMGDSYQDYYPWGDLPGFSSKGRTRRALWWEAEIDKTIEICKAGRGPADMVPVWEQLKASKTPPIPSDHRLYPEAERWSKLWQDIYANSDVYDRIQLYLTRLGWRDKTDAEIEAERVVYRRAFLDCRVELLRKLKLVEKRRAGPTPNWKIGICNFLGADTAGLGKLTREERKAADGTIPQRIRQAAESGRLSEQEFTNLRDLMGGRRRKIQNS